MAETKSSGRVEYLEKRAEDLAVEQVHDEVAAALLSGTATNERVHLLVAEHYEQRRKAASDPEPVLKLAWELAEAERHRAKHQEALDLAELQVIHEREFVAHWQAKYGEARRRLALVTYHSDPQPSANS